VDLRLRLSPSVAFVVELVTLNYKMAQGLSSTPGAPVLRPNYGPRCGFSLRYGGGFSRTVAASVATLCGHDMGRCSFWRCAPRFGVGGLSGFACSGRPVNFSGVGRRPCCDRGAAPGVQRSPSGRSISY